jgi:uncharacterized repeat protein (TIGR03943 family)
MIQKHRLWIPWLDALTLVVWGLLMLKYWHTGKLNILIHPAYHWLCVVGGLGLFAIGGFKIWQLWTVHRQVLREVESLTQSHLTLFPPGWGSLLLLVAAIAGLLITPRPFSSQTALQVGVTDLLSATRSQPQSFRSLKKPEDRTLIDWIRTLNIYPEPDEYTGDKVSVTGFVIDPPELPDGYLVIARFVITCCAADAYPIGLPVKLPSNSPKYPADSWLSIQGEMMTEKLADRRKLVIQAIEINKIPEPKNPYDY